MHIYAQKQQEFQQRKSGDLSQRRASAARSHKVHPALRLQQAIGNQAVQSLLQPHTVGLEAQRIQRQADDCARFKRVPPGPGAYTEAEYSDWHRRHPASVLEHAWEGRSTHGEYTPAWFWARGYFYSGSIYGGYHGARFEIWLNNDGAGHEYRLWQEAKSTVSTDEPAHETDMATDPDVEEARDYGKDRATEKDKLIRLVEELHKKIGTQEYDTLYHEYRRMEDQWLEELDNNIERVDDLKRSSDDDSRDALRRAQETLSNLSLSWPYGPEWGFRKDLPRIPGDRLRIEQPIKLGDKPKSY